jgi:hypothetical protein
MNGPTYEIREWQWREAFAKADGSWFCFVVDVVVRRAWKSILCT